MAANSDDLQQLVQAFKQTGYRVRSSADQRVDEDKRRAKCTHKKDRAFLRATAATAVAHLSHLSCLSVRPSVTRVDQTKTMQAGITKSSPSAAWKTLVSGSV